MRTITKSVGMAALLATSLLSTSANAQLAGHNVVLVHGFQQEDLSSPPQNLQAVKNNGADYWRTF
ncbi:hypothetical protein [Marinobacter caseinilyticus]|uniref:hypothetical protein n=1 Tax=Marinobacter caseinilyticus TaxID=2692195 RepID=UPI001F38F62D|nr:hypothetical protein [Marinobacter caseinilyticus]